MPRSPSPGPAVVGVTPILVAVIVLAVAFDYINGFHAAEVAAEVLERIAAKHQ